MTVTPPENTVENYTNTRTLTGLIGDCEIKRGGLSRFELKKIKATAR